MTTWDEAFAEHYDEWASGMKADVAFYVALASEAPPGAIVELAICQPVRSRSRFELRW
jgi:hypothetical protein